MKFACDSKENTKKKKITVLKSVAEQKTQERKNINFADDS